MAENPLRLANAFSAASLLQGFWERQIECKQERTTLGCVGPRELMHIGVDLDNTEVEGTTVHLVTYNRVSGQAKTVADADDFHLIALLFQR
ncbi:hypothetical protein [Sulfobacillus thermosulfidooxidans]|uniref:hypothetical protein n=1 Tax=Sulfobacillus thermosulfidooxidans TaxID=28034 RepID=UPI0006B489B2|nr:hypothetical protein [Sulfobacillus thermosulfidooxidans]